MWQTRPRSIIKAAVGLKSAQKHTTLLLEIVCWSHAPGRNADPRDWSCCMLVAVRTPLVHAPEARWTSADRSTQTGTMLGRPKIRTSYIVRTYGRLSRARRYTITFVLNDLRCANPLAFDQKHIARRPTDHRMYHAVALGNPPCVPQPTIVYAVTRCEVGVPSRPALVDGP